MSRQSPSDNALLAEWETLWGLAKTIPLGPGRREPLELTLAALVYQRRAIEILATKGRLHDIARDGDRTTRRCLRSLRTSYLA